MKKIFLLVAMVCALGMMTACKSGTENGNVNDSALVDSTLPDISDSIYDEITSESGEVSEVPEPSFSRFGNDIHKVSRTLSDAEIASLSFDSYQFCNYKSDFYKETLASWKDYSDKYRPYYSVVKCPFCGYNLMVVFGSSPNEYWQSLCGQEGYFAICTHCRKVLDYEIVAMN